MGPLAYPTTALDRGLRLIQLVRDEGSIRVVDAATELGVSRSSAHRLLQALVYRDFLVQNEDRRYDAGPALFAHATRSSWTHELKTLARPHMAGLSDQVGYSVNLMIHVDWHIRFLTCVTLPGGTLDRSGALMAAHLTAGGRTLLAQLDDGTLARAYLSPAPRPDSLARSLPPHARAERPSLSQPEFDQLLERVKRTRRSDFALSRGEVFRSDSAVATAIRDRAGQAIASLTLSARMPKVLDSREVDRVLGPLFEARQAVQSELVTAS